MNERQMQFRVGVVVLAAMIVGGLMAGYNGINLSWLGRGYQVSIEVPEAPGVDAKTPVRKNGIRIGRVKSIEDNGAGVLILVDIDGNHRLYADYQPHVRTSVLGDATIDFVGRPPADAQSVPPGTVFRGRVDPNPFDSLGQLGDLKNEFAAASRSLAQAGDEVAKLAKRVNTAFGDDSSPGGEGRVKRLLDTTESAMKQFEQTMHAVNDIIGDGPIAAAQPGVGQAAPFNNQPNTQTPGPNQQPGVQPSPGGEQIRQRLRQGLNELPDAIHEFRVTMQQSRDVLKSVEKNSKNLEAFTEPLGQKGPQVADAILKSIDGLDQLIRDLGDVAGALNNRNGTIGKLIHDPKLYNDLSVLMSNANFVLSNVNTVINDVSFQLKPILHDARVFMDKIAMEPGRVISGAVRPSNLK
jgi:phospholipid/cholesterol/gamma-HCH transport system substrate-binding protein